jgi:hypothetical protein
MNEQLNFTNCIPAGASTTNIVPFPQQATITIPNCELGAMSLGVIRQIIREEISAALQAHDQHSLDNLLTSIEAEPAPEDEIVAVLAEMTADEWETLVQRVKARKAAE